MPRRRNQDEEYVPSLEVRALALNINYGHNKALLDACRPLHDYSKFLSYVTMFKEEGNDLSAAVDMAVDMAIDEGLLGGYFARNKTEVVGMILSEYDETAVMNMLKEEAYEDGMNAGINVGEIKGENNNRRNVVINALNAGFDTAVIAQITDTSEEYVKEIQAELLSNKN